MSYILVTMFVAKYWSSENIEVTKDLLGKTLVLLEINFLLLFLRKKNLHQGGSNVKKMFLVESLTVTFK